MAQTTTFVSIVIIALKLSFSLFDSLCSKDYLKGQSGKSFIKWLKCIDRISPYVEAPMTQCPNDDVRQTTRLLMQSHYLVGQMCSMLYPRVHLGHTKNFMPFEQILELI